MATRTYCDKCGGECRNTVMRVHANITHTTSDGTYVGEDDVRMKELCRTCADVLIDQLGLQVRPSEVEMDCAPDAGINAAARLRVSAS